MCLISCALPEFDSGGCLDSELQLQRQFVASGAKSARLLACRNGGMGAGFGMQGQRWWMWMGG